MSYCTCASLPAYARPCPDCRDAQEAPTRPLPRDPEPRNFMPGCTCPGVAKGTACPLCGRVKG